jgi:uncharacterized protein with FMN-binding domain
MRKPSWAAVAGASAVMIAAGWKVGTAPLPDPFAADDAHTVVPTSGSASGAGTVPAGPSGTFTGNAVGTAYGTMQVEIVVSDGTIVDVRPLVLGLSDSQSRRINAEAVPILEQRVLNAQSASVSYVSGASYTSEGYLASVASAISRAGI